MNAPKLRIVPRPSPADLWVAAVRREIAPSALPFLTRGTRAPARRAPASVEAWISAVRREQAA